ncbi:MAG TPA: hypothetical protein VK302_00115 [Terriglobales bacterium]|nr:hypothetical protein [Terriglobales bacterium]
MAYLAQKYPQARLQDIAVAVGCDEKAAASAACRALEIAGTPRKRGAGSASYDRSKMTGAPRQYDHQMVIQWLTRRPDLSYKQIGILLHIPTDVVRYVANANNLGFHSGRKR